MTEKPTLRQSGSTAPSMLTIFMPRHGAAAGWLDAVTRRRERMAALRTEAPAVPLGGAAGTLAARGATGPRVLALVGALTAAAVLTGCAAENQAASALGPAAGMSEATAMKGGDDRTGQYDVVTNWWKAAPDHDEEWSSGQVAGVAVPALGGTRRRVRLVEVGW